MCFRSGFIDGEFIHACCKFTCTSSALYTWPGFSKYGQNWVTAPGGARVAWIQETLARWRRSRRTAAAANILLCAALEL